MTKEIKIMDASAFDAETESDFRISRFRGGLQQIFRLTRFLSILVFASVLAQWTLIPDRPNLAPIVLQLVCATFLAIVPLFQRIDERHFVTTTTIVYGFICLLMLALFAFAHEERRPMLAGLIYPTLIVLPFMPVPFRNLCAIAVTYCGGFVAIALYLDLFQGARVLVLGPLAFALVIALALCWIQEAAVRRAFLQTKLIERQQKHIEALLTNVFPGSIAERLKDQASREPVVKRFEQVTVLFADIVGFTALAQRLPPEDVVAVLDRVFAGFDVVTETLKVEKIKTIGDAYMVVSGAPDAAPDHADRIAAVALSFQATMARYREESGQDLHLRIGIASGPVVAGILGTKRFLYDLWGETVNLASRMESHGLPDEIQVAPSSVALLKDRYAFQERGAVEVKGVGPVRTYILLGPVASPELVAPAKRAS